MGDFFEKSFGSITFTTRCGFKWSRQTTSLRSLRENQFRFQSINLHNGIFDKFFLLSIIIYHISISFFLVFYRLKYSEFVRTQTWSVFCAKSCHLYISKLHNFPKISYTYRLISNLLGVASLATIWTVLNVTGIISWAVEIINVIQPNKAWVENARKNDQSKENENKAEKYQIHSKVSSVTVHELIESDWFTGWWLIYLVNSSLATNRLCWLAITMKKERF